MKLSFPRLSRALFVALVAALLSVAGFPASPAYAAPPTIWESWRPEAIPPGGSTQAILVCAGAEGLAASYTVQPPAGAPIVVPATVTSSDYLIMKVGPTVGIDTSVVGTYQVTASCPGFDPLVLPFEVLAPTLPVALSFSANGETCVPGTSFPVGTSLGACFDVTNNTGVDDIYRIGVYRYAADWTWQGANWSYPEFFGPEMPDGTTRQVTSSLGYLEGDASYHFVVILEEGVDQTSTGTGVFHVAGVFDVDLTATAPVTLEVTSGLSEASACAADGGEASRTVEAGTEVWLCYLFTNHTGLDLDHHTLVDDQLGTLFDDRSELLEPGESIAYVRPAPVTVDADVTHAATWSADDVSAYPVFEDGLSAVGSAELLVAAEEPVSTTTTSTTVATTVVPGVQAVSARPTYTG